MNPFGTLRRGLFGLGPRDLAPVLRHFEPGEPAVRARLGGVVESFALGYNLGLEAPTLGWLHERLQEHEPERQGFAYEGAGMSVALRVLMTPGSTLFHDYLRGVGDPHHYMIHIGAGWAWSRFPLRHAALQTQLDRTFHWLAWDGLGFHEAVFHTERTVERRDNRPTRDDYAGPAFDQGVGRALWFVCAGRPDEVARRIAAFAPERHADLWGGAGLAVTYACGVEEPVVRALHAHAGPFQPDMAVGSLLAVVTRRRAGNPTAHIDLACRVVTGMGATEALALYDTALDLHEEGDAAYPALRARIRGAMAARQAERQAAGA